MIETTMAVGRAALSTLALIPFFCLAAPLAAQTGEAGPADLVYHTFSLVAIDPETGESGAAVTTRNACVGNAVPWVRAGVGAVATQASTRVEYGPELLDLLDAGRSPADALAERTAADPGAESRQVGVIAADGRSAQHTGERTPSWSGHRSGATWAAQGNTLVGAEVVDAVARTFEASEGSGRHLADRLIEAMEAGQAVGGDSRTGRIQSAAVMVADPRPDIARRPDGVAVDINVCEHPTPVMELRRVFNTISSTLGFRTLQRQSGSDVFQLKIILHALGWFRPDLEVLERDDDSFLYTEEAIVAVDAVREAEGFSTATAGLVDEALVEHLWARLEEAGMAVEVRRRIRELTQVRR